MTFTGIVLLVLFVLLLVPSVLLLVFNRQHSYRERPKS